MRLSTMLCLVGVAFLSAACIRRVDVTTAELQKIEKYGEREEDLRVYASRRVVAVYETAIQNEGFDVDRKVDEHTKKRRVKVVLGRKTPGLILERDELKGQKRLWVSFDPACESRDCAWQFIESSLESGTYDLAVYPKRERHSNTLHQGCVGKRRVMRLGRIESLAEPNPVYLRRTRRGKAKRVHLVLRKNRRDEVKRKTERLRGVP